MLIVKYNGRDKNTWMVITEGQGMEQRELEEKLDGFDYALFYKFNLRIKLKRQALKMKREITQMNHNYVT